MKPLSPHNAGVLAQLNWPRMWHDRVRGRADEDIALISALIGEAALVPHLLPWVSAGPAPVRRAAAAALDGALVVTPPAELLQLDEACRRVAWTDAAESESGWRTLVPLQLAQLGVLGESELSALCVASFHANGYVREAAIAQLDGWTVDRSRGQELAFLLVRLNDWVAAVAERAMDAVRRRITPAYGAAWLRALPALVRLDARTRRNADDLVAAVWELLRARGQRTVLLEALATGERDTRRAVMRLLCGAEWAADDAGDVVRSALGDADPVVRVLAIDFARDRMARTELHDIMPQALADPYPPVRRQALATLVARMGELATPWLEGALLDRNAWIRELARFELRRLANVTEFAAFYRGQIGPATPSRALAAAIAGLGETGASDDIALIKPLVQHARPSVRAAAIKALGRCDVRGELALLLSHLADPSPTVTRAVRNVLQRHASALGATALRFALHNTASTHGRRDALVLAASLPKWTALVLLLEATATQDARVRADAVASIGRWIAQENKGFVAPSATQLGELRTSIARYGRALARGDSAALRSLVAYWQR